HEDRSLLEVQVAEEEAVALTRDATQLADALVDQRLGELRIEVDAEAGDGQLRDVDAQAARRVRLIAELVGPVVVDALALAAVLEAVAPLRRLEQAEEPGEAVAGLGEPGEVVVELQLEEVAVLADVARAGLREGEWVVLAAHVLGADPDRGVGTQAEAHLAAVVERQAEGGRRPGADRE